MTVNAQFVQEHFDEFIAAVETGETVEVTRDGKAPVRLVLAPVENDQPPFARQWGRYRDQIWLAPDWDSPETNAAIAADFEASEIFPLETESDATR